MKNLGLNRFILITSFLLFILAARFASAATYYVSQNGSASWSSCTVSSTPCAASTALANAAAGDTVLFLAGTYSVPSSSGWSVPGFSPAHSGTSGSPITFKANPGDTVTLANTTTNNAVGSNGSNYIVWDGFTVDCSGMASTALGGGAIINAASNVTLQNNTFIGHTGSVNDNHALIRLQSSTYTLIQNNTIKNQLSSVPNVDAAGIQNFFSTYTTVQNNLVYNCGVAFDEKDAGQNEVYRYNLVHDCGNGFHGPGNSSSDIINIYQNIFYNLTGTLLDIEQDWPGSHFTNNTVYNTTNGIGFWSIVTSATALTVYNNIFYATGTGSNYVVSYHGNGLAYDNYNDYYGNGSSVIFQNNYSNDSLSTWQGLGHDTNSITSSPNFVSTSIPDFHLQAGSPAITSGRGGSYPSAMGAYITGSEIIGLTSSTSSTGSAAKPDPPTGFMAL